MSSHLTPVSLFGELPLLKFRIRCTISPEASLPGSLGSAWRGLVGWELRRLVCPFSTPQSCTDCIIRDHCPYFLLFQQKSVMPGLADTPRGYIFKARPFVRGQTLDLQITLFGSCTRFFPVLRQSLLRAQQSGLGVARIPFRINSMEWSHPSGVSHPVTLDPEDYPMLPEPAPLKEWLQVTPIESGELTGDFLTPLRLRRQSRYLAELDWPFFFASLARRLEGLNVFFNDGTPLGRDTWKALNELFARGLDTSGSLRWQEQSRYSSRQKSRVPQGGLVGRVQLKCLPNWAREWLAAAELVHVGKGSSMGLGCVRIHAIGRGDSSDAPTGFHMPEGAHRGMCAPSDLRDA